MISYSGINHDFRVKNNLSVDMYVLCDTIFYMCTTRKYSEDMWVRVDMEKLSDFFIDIPAPYLSNMIDRLVNQGFLEKDEKGRVSYTQTWYELYASVPSH